MGAASQECRSKAINQTGGQVMQTFLPYPSFRESARCLDTKRLGKQRVECKQILVALGVGVGQHHGNSASRWRNHPAVAMWRGHEQSLAEYSETVCDVWQQRGFKDTLRDQFRKTLDELARYSITMWRNYPEYPAFTTPEWLGCERLHASHRSNLLRKDATHYGQFGWSETADLPYWWPTQQEAAA